MEVIKRINPGQPGSKHYLQMYGESLVCVRYRHDRKNNKRITTIELVVDKGCYFPDLYRSQNIKEQYQNKIVYLHIGYNEKVLRSKVKLAGASWDADKKCWKMKYQDVLNLGLEDRIIKE